MNTALKWFLVFCILCATFAIPVMLQMVLAPQVQKKAPISQNTETTPLPNTTIRFVSIAPTIAKMGDTFSYRVVVQAIPEQTLSVTAPTKPEWLTWDSAKLTLTGIVPVNTPSFTVTLRATAQSGEKVDQTFTVVADAAEQSVKGAKTTADPFHPSITVTKAALIFPSQPEATQSITITPSQQVLGEKAEAQPSIEVTYLIYGTVAFLCIACGYLLSRILHDGKRATHKTASGVVIQSIRS